MPFPDAEDAIVELLEDAAPVYTEPPEFTSDAENNPEQLVNLPLIVVKEIPGGSQSRNGLFSTALVEVQCFGVKRAESKALREQVRARLTACNEGVQTAAGFIDSITETSAPAEIPYEQEDTRRVTSTWLVASRTQ